MDWPKGRGLSGQDDSKLKKRTGSEEKLWSKRATAGGEVQAIGSYLYIFTEMS